MGIDDIGLRIPVRLPEDSQEFTSFSGYIPPFLVANQIWGYVFLRAETSLLSPL